MCVGVCSVFCVFLVFVKGYRFLCVQGFKDLGFRV